MATTCGWGVGRAVLPRFTRSTGQRTVFREGPRSLLSLRVRDIETVDGYIWVGTDRGLSVYALASSRWRHELTIGDDQDPVPLAAIASAGGVVFAGTLGRGLWRDDGSGWSRIEGALPGLFITALQVVGDTLWIGTIDLGLVSLDLASGAVRSFDEINPDLGPQNVTAIVPDAADALWITTFGAGVYRWQPGANRISHFSVAGGQLPDDWVLSGAAGDNGIYFGTFGGGVARYSHPGGTWAVISLAHGLPSLNVAVVTAVRGNIYFGTLGGGVGGAVGTAQRARPVGNRHAWQQAADALRGARVRALVRCRVSVFLFDLFRERPVGHGDRYHGQTGSDRGRGPSGNLFASADRPSVVSVCHAARRAACPWPVERRSRTDRGAGVGHPTVTRTRADRRVWHAVRRLVVCHQ